MNAPKAPDGLSFEQLKILSARENADEEARFAADQNISLSHAQDLIKQADVDFEVGKFICPQG